MNYQLFFNSLGQFESANTEDGRSIPYYPLNPTYSKLDDPLTIAFLEAVEAEEIDISDRPVETEQPQPDWNGLVATFTFPGNPLYLSIVSKVGASGFVVQDHWQNFKDMVISVRNQDGFAAAVNHLSFLLEQAGHGLSTAEQNQWNELVDQFNFPESCRLISQ